MKSFHFLLSTLALFLLIMSIVVITSLRKPSANTGIDPAQIAKMRAR